MSHQLVYLLLIFCLLVVPRALQRFNIPAPVTCLLFGIVAVVGWGQRAHDPVFNLLSTIGISSLFLFAGLEVDLAALRRRWAPLATYLLIRGIKLLGVGWLSWFFLDLSWQAAGLFALALLTPSTGFILESLDRLGLDEEERFWVTSKAIAGELVALAALFFVLQTGDAAQLALSSAAMLGLLIGVPLLFIALGRWVVPHAPGSEFSLLVLVGLIAGFATFALGIYYLVGAFVVGLIARLLHERMPALASDENLRAVQLFASFFVPIYFFVAGTHVAPSALGLDAIAIGIAMTIVILPLRIGAVWLQRRVIFGAGQGRNLRVALALTPTLVFTLVLMEILGERFGLPDRMVGALVVYTVINTTLPSLLLRLPLGIGRADEGGPGITPLANDPAEPSRAGP